MPRMVAGGRHPHCLQPCKSLQIEGSASLFTKEKIETRREKTRYAVEAGESHRTDLPNTLTCDVTAEDISTQGRNQAEDSFIRTVLSWQHPSLTPCLLRGVRRPDEELNAETEAATHLPAGSSTTETHLGLETSQPLMIKFPGWISSLQWLHRPFQPD